MMPLFRLMGKSVTYSRYGVPRGPQPTTVFLPFGIVGFLLLASPRPGYGLLVLLVGIVLMLMVDG